MNRMGIHNSPRQGEWVSLSVCLRQSLFMLFIYGIYVKSKALCAGARFFFVYPGKDPRGFMI